MTYDTHKIAWALTVARARYATTRKVHYLKQVTALTGLLEKAK